MANDPLTAQPTDQANPPEAAQEPLTPTKAKPSFVDTWLGKVTAGGAIAAVTCGLTIGAPKIFSSSSPSPSSSPPPPKVHITGAAWVTSAHHPAGQYRVIGYVDHLAAGQVIWSFNQPDDSGQAGRIYPDPGPCDLTGQTFTCDLGTATQASQYTIIVAVVTEGQGYSFTRQKIGFDPYSSSQKPIGFSSLDAIPHIMGSEDSTMLSQ